MHTGKLIKGFLKLTFSGHSFPVHKEKAIIVMFSQKNVLMKFL